MFKFKLKPTHRKKYREELLGEMTGRSKRAIQAYFRRNGMSIENSKDLVEYLKKFSPYFK